METHGRTRDGDGSGDENESSSGYGNGDEDGNADGNDDRIGEGEGEAKKRNRTRVEDAMWETGKTWVEREKCRQDMVSSAAANPDNLEKGKEAGGKHKVPSVSPLSRLIRGFRNKHRWSPLGRISASGIDSL